MEWDSALTDTDRFVIETGGWGTPRGLGSRPALIIIDIQQNYLGDDVPLLESLKRWPVGAGSKGWEAVRRLRPVLDTARIAGIPIIYSRQIHREYEVFALKRRRHASESFGPDDYSTQIPMEIKPAPGDIVLQKQAASLFFGTPLLGYLIKENIDSLLIAGCSTSGCVRATVVDASSYHFHVAVIRDCVFDRIELSHKAALLDIWMKYGDLMTSEEVKSYLMSLQ